MIVYNMSTEIDFSDFWDVPLFKDDAISPDEWKKLKLEIGETKEKRQESLGILIKKLKEQKDFKSCTDVRFLIGFLRVSKFDISKAYNRIERYYRHMRSHNENYRKIFDRALNKSKTIRHFWIGPHRMEDNSIVFVLKHCAYEPDEISLEEMFHLYCLPTNQIMAFPSVQLGGVTIILDFAGFTLRKLLMYTPRIIATYIKLVQSVFSLRIKRIHMINANFIFHIFFKMANPMLPQKIRNRIAIHPIDEKFESLLALVSPKVLPEEYGGSVKQADMIDALAVIKELDVEFKKHLQFGFKNKSS